jgi:hypothetical protein
MIQRKEMVIELLNNANLEENEMDIGDNRVQYEDDLLDGGAHFQHNFN